MGDSADIRYELINKRDIGFLLYFFKKDIFKIKEIIQI